MLCLVDYAFGNFCVRLALLEEILLFFWKPETDDRAVCSAPQPHSANFSKKKKNDSPFVF